MSTLSKVLEPSTLIAELERHEPVPDPQLVADAKAMLSKQLTALSLTDSVMTSVLMSVARRVFTSAVDTYAVMLPGDGHVILAVNPEFCLKLGEDGGVFVLVHEASHLLWRHLYLDDPHLAGDDRWQMATEACINQFVMSILKRRDLPVVDAKPSGVDPRKLHAQYRDDLKTQGKDPKSYDDFIRTDLGCYAELCRMTKPPSRRNVPVCVHHHGDPDSGSFPAQNSRDTTHVVKRTLGLVMKDARSMSKAAKRELLELEARSEGSPNAERFWGDLGMGAFRGQTTTVRKTRFWEAWVRSQLATRIRPGDRLRYLKKIWWDPRLAYRGRELYKKGVIAVDTSGSMHQAVIDRLAEMTGTTENLVVEWISFDAAVYPFTPGEPFQGGGGTSFEVVQKYVETLDEEPDFVLMVTDGYAPEISPKDPSKWVWLIVSNGNDWPERHSPPMDTYRISDDELVA